MKFSLCVLLLVLITPDDSFAKNSCRTCQGADCLKKNVLLLDCTKFVPVLPFEDQLIIKNDAGDLEYGCLELEYYKGENLHYIQQCILAKHIESFCDTLEYSVKASMVKVNKCSIEPLVPNRTRRSMRNEVVVKTPTTEKPESSTKESEPTTKDPKSTTETSESTSGKTESTTIPVDTTTQPEGSTTPSQASVATAISLMSFVGALVLFVL